MNRARVAFWGAALAAALVAAPSSLPGEDGGTPRLALGVAIDGPIGPARVRQLEGALELAAARGAEVLVLQLNTPGGLVTSMREMIADILASPVPVIGYVAPAGGHAASAGTFILYATHVAAMAPGTNLGAATPVGIGGPLPLPDGGDGAGEDDGKDAATPPADAMAAKATNDAVALIRSLAELRGRNADWGEQAVRRAASLSANAALREHVIDFVARDTAELLRLADGRTVDVAGRTRVLATKGLEVETIEPGWRIRLLAVITDPNIAILLMIAGFYGLVFEFSAPGAIAPGVVGAICLLLGLYGLNLLPINHAGLALMLLGIALLVAEVFNPTLVLGLGGTASFLIGAALLLEVEGPGFELSWVVLGVTAALTLGLAVLAGSHLWAARHRPSRIGARAMDGLSAEVVDWTGGEGHVLVQGERWRARAGEPFARGDRVEVAGSDNLVLIVRRPRKQTPENGGPP